MCAASSTASSGTARTAFADLLAAIVRDDPVDATALAAVDPDAFGREAIYHGVLALVSDRLAARDDLPGLLAAVLRAGAAESVAADLQRDVAVKRVVSALADAGVDPLLMKGTHLAYSYYPRPHLRPSVDTDILIPQAARRATHDELVKLGYVPDVQVSGDFVAHQAFYRGRSEWSGQAVDVHWKISNQQVFAGVVGYDELARDAVALPRLHPAARGLSGVHALLLACVHRVAHHDDSDHLIWLYDISVIARTLGPAEWHSFVDLAVDRNVAAVCRRSLDRAALRFGWLPAAAADGMWPLSADEFTARYLVSRRHVYKIVDDVRALSRWSDRWQLVREHLFPPADYMRRVYAPASASPLPVLYLARLFRGGRKWLRLQSLASTKQG
jgi:hypothetical protein